MAYAIPNVPIRGIFVWHLSLTGVIFKSFLA